MTLFLFLRDNFRWLLGGYLLAFFSSYGQTFFISLSGNDIRREFGLSHGDFGLIYMGATLASAVCFPFVGALADRFAISRLAVVVICFLALATFLMSQVTSLIMLPVIIFMLRLFGQGMMTHTSMTAMGKWYSAHRGRAVAIAGTGQQSGDAVFPIIVVTLFAIYGWRTGWMLASATLLLLALPAIFLLMRVERIPRGTKWAPSGPVSPHESARDWNRKEVLRDPLFWLSLVGVLAPGFIGTTIFFHPQYLVELRGWEMQTYALSYTCMAITTVIFALIAGQLIDRFSAKRVLPFFLPPLAMACLVLANFEQVWAMFAFMTMLGVSYGFSTTLTGALWPELYGRKNLGAIRAMVIAMMVFSTALGPGITGWLIDQKVSYLTQINTMALWCIFACLVLIYVSRKASQRAKI